MKTHFVTFLRPVVTVAVLAACLLVAPAATAQVQQPDYSNYGFNAAKIQGRIQVAAFDYNISSLGSSSFATWNNFPNGCRMDIPGYGATVPFNAAATVKVNDLTTPANTETVSLTSFTSVAPTCAPVLSTANSHTGSYRLQSGTCGLKEAVLIFGGSAANYEVGQPFYDRGCTAATITGVTGSAAGSVLLDSSNGVFTWYVSNGANFIKATQLTSTGLNFAGNKIQVAADFTTANNTNLQTITGLTWNVPATAINYSFHCGLSYSQATANVAVAFGIQAATNAPNNIFATGHQQTNTTAFADGTLATLNTTAATSIVSATPAATATLFDAILDGTIENPASANAISIMVSTAAGADAVTVKRGSYCVLY